MKKIPIIIDCDPGVDDVLAIILANSDKKFDIRAMTSVSGNVSIEKTTYNLRLVSALLSINCPIAKGAHKPLKREAVIADEVHGSDGFGGLSSLITDVKLKDLSEFDAVDLIANTIKESDEKITIIAVGPLTNIAQFTLKYPDLLNKVKEISIMGGGVKNGNITEHAEFNFYVDPEAAKIVMNCGIPIILSSLDVTLQAYLTDEDQLELSSIKNKVATIANKAMFEYTRYDPAIHDPISILALSSPELFESVELCIDIETQEIKRGKSFIVENGKKNCKFITTIDRNKFVNRLKESLSYYN
ncbi:MAG: nucleoside hydrolase [Erysipelotrichaceae bacterium]